MGHLLEHAAGELAELWLATEGREDNRLRARNAPLARALDRLATAHLADTARRQHDASTPPTNGSTPPTAELVRVAPAVRLDREDHRP